MHHLVEHGSDGLVVCGTTGEAATLNDEEHLGVMALAVQEMKGFCTVVAGVGSNDTRHAVELTERATDSAPTPCCRSTPTTTGPAGGGSSPTTGRSPGPPTCRSCSTTSPAHGSDMPNDLLAELAQLDNIVAVKQANPDNLAKVEGLEIYAGNDDMLADVLDLGEAGRRSSPAATSSARRCGGWSTSRSTGGRSTPGCRTSTATWRSRRPPPSRRRST